MRVTLVALAQIDDRSTPRRTARCRALQTGSESSKPTSGSHGSAWVKLRMVW